MHIFNKGAAAKLTSAGVVPACTLVSSVQVPAFPTLCANSGCYNKLYNFASLLGKWYLG